MAEDEPQHNTYRRCFGRYIKRDSSQCRGQDGMSSVSVSVSRETFDGREEGMNEADEAIVNSNDEYDGRLVSSSCWQHEHEEA